MLNHRGNRRGSFCNFRWIQRLLVLLALFFSAAFGSSPGAAEEREKRVFAHHMGSLNAGRGAMAWHTRHPELGDPETSNGGDYRALPLVPYDQWNLTLEESAHLQIRRAMRIGLDGFAVSAWAGGEEAKLFLDALFKVAEENDYPFYLSICPDPSAIEQPEGLTHAIAGAIRHLLDRHGDSPKLARSDGKPVIFGYRSAFVWVEYLQSKYEGDQAAVDLARTSEEGWALVGPAYESLEQLVGQELYVQFDMGAFYNGLKVRGVPENEYARAAAVARQVPAVCESLPSARASDIAQETVDAGAEWGEPIYMNYDNPRTGPGTEELRRRWEEARAFDSTLLQLTTWNDYHENTNLSLGTGPVRMEGPNTGGWQRWQNVIAPGVRLEEGVQTMRLLRVTGDFNVNFIEVRPAATTFSAWREVHFSAEEIEDPAIGGAMADASKNGIPNLLECALSRDPRAGGRGGLPEAGDEIIDGNRYLTFSYTRPIKVQDLDYRVEVSENLINVSGDEYFTPLPATQQGDSEVVELRDAQPADSSNRRFIRLRVERAVQESSE